MADRQYSRDEMQAILARAIHKQAAAGSGSDDLSHAQLLETAKEVGLSPAEIASAIAEFDAHRGRAAGIAALRVRQRHQLRNHVAAFVAVNLGLWAIDAVTAGGASNGEPGWHWIVAASWGVGLLLHAWRVWSADEASLAAAAARWERRRQRKQREAAMARAIEGAVTDAVTEGANALSRLLNPDGRPRKRPDRDDAR